MTQANILTPDVLDVSDAERVWVRSRSGACRSQESDAEINGEADLLHAWESAHVVHIYIPG